MSNYIILSVAAALIILSSASISQAEWSPDPFCPYPSEHVTKYPYYGNCSIYWECYEGTRFLVECPTGLEFNAHAQECDAPEVANCDPYASTTPRPTGPTTSGTTKSTESPKTSTTERHTTSSTGPQPDCPYPSEEMIYYPYPGDCNKYYECFEGHKYVYNCPEGLWWHQEVKQCDYPGDYCNNATTPTPSTAKPTSPTTTPTPEFKCPYPSNEVLYFPYPGDCSKYYECYDGDQYLYQCPTGLWWHNEVTECDYPGDYCVQEIMRILL